jgi:hypothetical protein
MPLARSRWPRRAGVLVVCLLLAITAFAIGGGGSAYAQQGANAEPTREQLELQISIMRDQVKKIEQGSQSADPELEKAYRAAKIREYRFWAEQMDLNVLGYDAHRFASYIVLVLVCVVVASGIVFAGFQLWKSLNIAGVQATSDLEISASKVRVTSSVVGVIVLTISLVFLFIYTKYVFPIERVDTIKAEAPKQAASR